MNLYLLKILGIIIVTMCCLIATYTDVKYQIIPNKLTFLTIIIGIVLESVYFTFNKFNPSYFISILIIYIFSYILWRLGVWAGGDVKLFTAISTLLVPEFLDVLPNYVLWGFTFPFNLMSVRIPTLLVIFNSILSIIPIVLIYVSWIILNDKTYLKGKFKKSFNFKEVFLSLNSLILAYTIISEINVYHLLLKIVFLAVLSYIISKMLRYDILLIIFTPVILIQQIITGNLISYFLEFLLLLIIISVKNIYYNRIIKEALTEEVKVFDLDEGMILQYPLYFKDNEYYFDKSPWYNLEEKGILICSNNARGITVDEINILKEKCPEWGVSIKKGLPFAPFILTGLLITLTIGNTYQLLIILWGLIG